ncbi:MAG: ethanolamine ammonia-lyase subunit EutC [Ruminiclostridium sp.]|nr:ethanolamine ammonia-lyase subunit EutC [Ruminiclostridium sp.]
MNQVNPELIAAIVTEIVKQLESTGSVRLPGSSSPDFAVPAPAKEWEDITSPECKAIPLIENPEDPEALQRMMKRTTARIGVGRAGSRLKTQTMLALRADHAQARDAVFADVNPKVLEEAGLFTVQTMCEDKNTYVTRPDLGRQLSPEAVQTLREKCVTNPDVQIYAADGLSSTAIEANLNKILPVITESLTRMGLKVGTPFYLRFGRVGSQEHVAETLGAKVVCTLIGERPGLATAESMSAYISYNAYVGMPESKRTVVSNIHKNGTAAVEAGAYVAEVIAKILEQKASGVDLVK